MSANEEQLEAHLARQRAGEAERATKREAFVRSLVEAYDEAMRAVIEGAPDGQSAVEVGRRVNEAHRAGLLAAVEKAMRAHAADLLRIECELNGALNDKRPGPHKHKFAACHAVGQMRRLRARMRGRAKP